MRKYRGLTQSLLLKDKLSLWLRGWLLAQTAFEASEQREKHLCVCMWVLWTTQTEEKSLTESGRRQCRSWCVQMLPLLSLKITPGCLLPSQIRKKIENLLLNPTCGERDFLYMHAYLYTKVHGDFAYVNVITCISIYVCIGNLRRFFSHFPLIVSFPLLLYAFLYLCINTNAFPIFSPNQILCLSAAGLLIARSKEIQGFVCAWFSLFHG